MEVKSIFDPIRAQNRARAMSQMIIARQQPGALPKNPGARPNNDEEDVSCPTNRDQQVASAH